MLSCRGQSWFEVQYLFLLKKSVYLIVLAIEQFFVDCYFRFVSPSYGSQLIRPVVQQGRKYRPHRHASNNQQIRISRPNSNSSEADQKSNVIFLISQRLQS